MKLLALCCSFVIVALLAFYGKGKTFKAKDDSNPETLIFQMSEFKLPTPQKSSTATSLEILGSKIFYDSRLSKDGKVSCAFCHIPSKAFQNGGVTPDHRGHKKRNTPALFNLKERKWFGWDGRSTRAGFQALRAMQNVQEHNLDINSFLTLMKKFYAKEFEEAFAKGLGAKDKSSLCRDVPQHIMAPEVTRFIFDSMSTAVRQKTGFNGSLKVFEAWLGRDYAKEDHCIAWNSIPEANFKYLLSDLEKVMLAIEAYLFGIVTMPSAFDDFVSTVEKTGRIQQSFTNNFSKREFEGFKVFVGKGQCHLCHSGPQFSNEQFHNVALGTSPSLDVGRSLALADLKRDPGQCDKLYKTRSPACDDLDFLNERSLQLVGAFRTQGLRNVALTAPYAHDGSILSLRDVLVHYNAPFTSPQVGRIEGTIKPAQLTTDELESLEAFLNALTSDVKDSVLSKTYEFKSKVQMNEK